MTSVELYELDMVVEFDENETFSVTMNNGDKYEECALTKGTNRHLIAHDPDIGAWILLI